MTMSLPEGGSYSPVSGEETLSLPPALLRELEQALRSTRFGTIELVIHAGRVVQLERREKVRLEAELRKHGK